MADAKPAPGSRGRRTILLVEDEMIIAMATKTTLESYGYDIRIAGSGEEAVAAVQATPGIDLVLMDINLGGGMDGTETAALILKQRDMPVVFLSSHMEPDIVEKTEKITSYGYVVKNSSVTVLDASIKMAFKLFAAKVREKEKEAALAHSHELMKYVIEHMSGAVAIHDRDLNYIYVSQRYLNDYKVKEKDVIGRHHYDVFPDLPQKWRDVHQRALAGEISSAVDDPYERADGSLEWTRWECRPWHEADGSIGGIIIYTEVTTEHKLAGQALRASEERMRVIVEGTPHLFFYTQDNEANTTYVSPTIESITGYDAATWLKRRDWFVTDAEINREARARTQAHLRGESGAGPVQLEIRHADGRKILLEAYEYPIVREGRIVGLQGVAHDISERARSERLTQTLYGISQAVHSSRNLPVLYGQIHGLIGAIVPAANFYIAVLSDDGTRLEFPYYRDEKDDDTTPIPSDDPHSLTTEVLRARRPLLLDEGQLRERYAKGRNRTWGTAPKCWLGIPLEAQDRIIGVMAIQDYSNGRAYGPQEVALLEATAGQIALAIDRKRTEAALRESVAAFKGYFNIGTVGMAVTSPDKGWIEVNDCLCRMLGYSRQELAGMTWSQLTHPGDLDSDLGLFNEVMAGRRDSYELEKRFIHKDGRVIHTRLYVTCQRHADGKVRHFLAALINISQSRQAEEALRQSEAAQSAALQMTKSGHWEYDVDTDMFTFNDNFYRIFRTTAAREGGYRMSSAEYARRFCHPDDAPKVGEETRAAIEASDPNYSRQVEHRILYADGEVGWIAVRFFIAKDPRGRTIRTYGVNQDISERKRAEEEIKRQLAEKEVLLKEVHHRIKNNIAAIGGLITLRLKAATHPEAAAVLQETLGRIDSMRVLYDTLLLGDDYKDVPVRPYVESLAAAVISLFPGQTRVKLDMRLADLALDRKRLFPLGLIINELLTNKLKYAFAGREKGVIAISLEVRENRATLAVEDNGDPLPREFDPEKSRGFGLTLVRMLSQQLGGSFAIDKGKGSRCTVEFPI